VRDDAAVQVEEFVSGNESTMRTLLNALPFKSSRGVARACVHSIGQYCTVKKVARTPSIYQCIYSNILNK
jgi:hypothetical protein